MLTFIVIVGEGVSQESKVSTVPFVQENFLRIANSSRPRAGVDSFQVLSLLTGKALIVSLPSLKSWVQNLTLDAMVTTICE
jgi:hypothetical protein